MIEFISKDEKVMLELGQSKLKKAINDFSSVCEEDNINAVSYTHLIIVMMKKMYWRY